MTYVGLYEHLKKIGLGDKLLIDVPDLGGGSVMGNALDRGVGYTPMGEYYLHYLTAHRRSKDFEKLIAEARR